MGFSDDFNRSDRAINGDPIPGTGYVWTDFADVCNSQGSYGGSPPPTTNYGEIISGELALTSGTDANGDSQALVSVPTTAPITTAISFDFDTWVSGAGIVYMGLVLGANFDCTYGNCLIGYVAPFPATWTVYTATADEELPTILGNGVGFVLGTGVTHSMSLSWDGTNAEFVVNSNTLYSGVVPSYPNALFSAAKSLYVGVGQQAAYTGAPAVPVTDRQRVQSFSVTAYSPSPDFDGDTSPGAFTPRSKRSWQERVPAAYYDPDTSAGYPGWGPYKPGRVT